MMLTIKETAQALGLKVRTIREWIRKGKLHAEKHGKLWYIAEEDLNREEIQDHANKSREHSKRIAEGRKLGVLAGRG